MLEKKSQGNKSKRKIRSMYKWFLIEMKKIGRNKKTKSWRLYESCKKYKNFRSFKWVSL